MEWNNEVIMEFLDMYEGEPVIWNPQNEHHTDRNQVYDAWKRIQVNISIDCSLKELKKKKETLMATYRKLAMKVKNSATGNGTNELYRPEWFAYNKMASFLHSVYIPRGAKTNGKHESEPYNNEDLPDDEHETPSNDIDPLQSPFVTIAPQDQESNAASMGKKRKTEQTAHIEKCLDEAYHFLKQVASKSKVAKDESYLFCELLCSKLRALDYDTREVAMYEINNLMFHLKNSREKQPNIPFQHYNQQHGYFQQGIMNQYQSSGHGSGESSVLHVSPTQTPSTSSTPQDHLEDIKVEVYSPKASESSKPQHSTDIKIEESQQLKGIKSEELQHSDDIKIEEHSPKLSDTDFFQSCRTRPR